MLRLHLNHKLIRTWSGINPSPSLFKRPTLHTLITTTYAKNLIQKPSHRTFATQPEPPPETTNPTSPTTDNNDQKKPKPSTKELTRLMSLAKPESTQLSKAIGLLLISSSVTMSVPFAMGKIIDLVLNPTAVTETLGLTLPTFFGVLGGVFAIGAIANFGRVILFRLSGERIVMRLRNDLFRSLLRQDLSFFDAERSGDLISRLSVDTNVMGKSLTQNISDGLRSLVMSVAGLSMMFYVNTQLTLIMMTIVPPIAFAAVLYGRYVKKLSKQTQSALAEITKVAEEKLGNIRTVHAFAKEDKEVKLFEGKVQELFGLARKEAFASGAFFGGAGFSGNITILALLWYGGQMVMDGAVSVGSLTSFMLFTAYVGSSLIGLTNFYSEVMKGLGASSRVFEILDRQPEIITNVGKILPSAHGNITFSNVNFTYPTRPQTQIFNDVSFTVEPGTVCGSSGSGKSTLGSLLLRFYDPQSGTISIDGTAISELNLEWWRNQIGLVSQEPVLFADTIRENIAYGNNKATMEDIEAAAVKANCAGFINSFPKKYDTFVGERGISLSGGQKQRIAIARALLKDPSILILDEATSALDAESEKLVQEALERLMQGRTVFTIAHRISTIKSADRILCFDGGRIAEIGTYQELLKKPDGVFRNLVKNQLLH